MRATKRFSRVNRDKTAANADEVLTQYPSRKAMTLRWSAALQSPNMDGMPRTSSTRNTAEDKVMGHLDDLQYVKQVEYIINELMPEVSRDENWASILRLTYMTHGGLEPSEVQDRLGIEHSAFYEARKDALCAFAELWPPFPAELVVKNR